MSWRRTDPVRERGLPDVRDQAEGGLSVVGPLRGGRRSGARGAVAATARVAEHDGSGGIGAAGV